MASPDPIQPAPIRKPILFYTLIVISFGLLAAAIIMVTVT